MNLEKVDILGIPFVNTTKAQFVKKLDEHLANQDKVFVVTANPEIVMKAREDEQYKKVIDQATYITADGIGVVKAAQLLNKPIPERVTGYDTMLDLLELAQEKQYSIYLLGGQQETLEKAVANIKASYPKINIVGQHNGFFDWSSNTIQQEISEKKPDLIFVALGVPRQENWIAQNLSAFEKGVCIGVGGSFDVIAGTVERAPEMWQKANLEWLYRLIKQPSRWKRMLALPRFGLKILKVKVTGKYE
ncbi:WecB/TagA/CpsF family glycosyltransferase [Robertmurraya andreesenii]|uniref:N-acetylglucosaminyldiphosphoundecaprenol N-acetyl-beta-D-mannosaminyltransferase n=1 Tax=Anoxybacillus andreesenii TaxID=1325932 RepID=A0ABT9V031_9BACL|nr:WecB/TagA/CpsF family glycosyltransferase [Robertmurraya andreesenii]MDQ0154260.1 N-acetylglucosaminyldiphosphoundecaprenol N-acetyl-beta-D-mannosaminyltransferase [Robertmurraya andreesenii]